MKTNFTRENFLVLTNNGGKIIAIIQCESGKQNIANKVVKAIGEDYDADAIIFKNINERILDDYDYEFDFKVIIKSEGDEYEENFTLTFTTIY